MRVMNKMQKPIRKQIKEIEFGLISPESVKKISCAKIVTPELYDIDGYPVDGGLMDLRLGAIDPGVRCRTCGGRLKECLGHPGSIELARAVIHLKYVTLIELGLKCYCQECSKFLIYDDELKKAGINGKTCRPEWAVLTNLLVPPVTVRPSIILESGERSEDDLTHKLSD